MSHYHYERLITYLIARLKRCPYRSWRDSVMSRNVFTGNKISEKLNRAILQLFNHDTHRIAVSYSQICDQRSCMRCLHHLQGVSAPGRVDLRLRNCMRDLMRSRCTSAEVYSKSSLVLPGFKRVITNVDVVVSEHTVYCTSAVYARGKSPKRVSVAWNGTRVLTSSSITAFL